MKTTVNGKELAFTAGADTTAIEVIRQQAGLTGTKLVCGAGVCGACTILLDGVAVNSCMLAAHALEGKTVRTVEAHGPENLHPVQKAFLAHDGLQCGFCTPGFINEAIAFYDRWRGEQGRARPSVEEVVSAMAGHLCRCAAYVGIYEAVRSACAGDFDEVALPDYPRVEAMEKVCGRAQYTVDVQHESQLTGKILPSPYAHARVLEIDTEEAEALAGVQAVVDILDDPHRVVRYVGQPIVAVAATDEATAVEAIKKIRIKYEVLPFVADMDAALLENAPEVYPESKKSPPNASEGPIPPGKWEGNLRKPYINWFLSKSKGRAEKRAAVAEETADLEIVSRTYRTPGQTHTALEPHAAVAWWDGPEKAVVHASTQTIQPLARAIAKHFGLKKENVTVLAEYVGGAFGAKQGMTTEIRAALELSRKAQLPVRLVYDRLEEMTLGGYRPYTKTELTLVADKSGNGKAVQASIYGDCGVAVQSQVAPWIRYTYQGISKSVQDFDVVTNAAPAKPFRAPSGPAAFWALESAVDEMAHKLGIDPVALRRKWDTNEIRPALYDWAETVPEWVERPAVGSSPGRFKRGIGLAIGNWFNIFFNDAQVELVLSDRGVVAKTAASDMGNGLRSVVAKAVAGELGINPLEVRVEVGNSHFVEGPVSTGSRATNSLYPTAKEAAQQAKDYLLKAAAAKWSLENPVWEKGGVSHAGGSLTLADLLEQLPGRSFTAKRGSNGPWDILGKLPAGEMGFNGILKMTGSVNIAQVVVDTRLARIRVEKVWAGFGAGKIVNPELARSQIYGGIIQGMGYALYEERQVDPLTATLLTYGLEDYRIPGIGDIPEIDIHFYEGGFESVRGEACGLSELSTLAIAPAIGNAVFHATGWRPTEIPLRPHRLIQHI